MILILSLNQNIILDNGRYYVFVGADGPCSVALNVGGKIFRSHHDEVNKGLIAGN